ncbi:hypothetical protein [Solimonas terrae]|nr:hypothetical protein [Solimonas terrae]
MIRINEGLGVQSKEMTSAAKERHGGVAVAFSSRFTPRNGPHLLR